MSIHKKITISLIYILLSSVNAFAADLTKLNYLKSIDVFSSDKEVRVVIDLKKKLNKFINPYFYEKSFQIDLPKTYLNPSKRLFTVKDNLIDNIYAVQHSPETTRIRFLFGKDKVTNMKDLSIKKDKYKLILSFKRSIIPSAAKAAPKQTLEKPSTKKAITVETTETKQPAAEVTEEEDYVDDSISSALKLLENNNIKDFQENLLNTGTAGQQPEEDKKDTAEMDSKESKPLPVMPDMLSLSYKMVSSLAIILAIIIFLSFALKKYLSKNGKGPGRNTAIKVVSTCYIGPKKSIALIDVADELLVVGISNNHISMLTKLDKKEPQDEIEPVINETKVPINKSPDFSKLLDKAQSTEENKEGTISKVTEIIQERMNKMGAL